MQRARSSFHAWVAIALGAAAVIVGAAAPAFAQDIDIDLGGGDDTVVLSGEVTVPEGTTSGDVVIFDGPVRVDGTVNGSVVAFNGRVEVAGVVRDDIVNLNGRVVLEDGAEVGGDLVTRLDPEIAPGATIVGEQRTVDPEVVLGPFSWAARFAIWVAVSVSTLVLGLLLLLVGPRAAARVADVATRRVGPAIGWGAILFFGLPIFAVVMILTLVGIPFGVGLLLGLATVYAVGYVAGAHFLGRLVLRAPRSAFLAFLIGWGILRLVALVPALGGLTWFAATLYGLGALAVATWTARAPAAPVAAQPVPSAPAPQAPAAPQTPPAP